MRDDLSGITGHVNRLLCEDIPDDRFVTASFGVLDPEAVSVRASSAQRYVSVSIVVWVDDRRQLEEAYAELKAEPEVLLYI